MRFPVVYHLVNTVLQTVDGFALRKGLNIGNFGRLHNYYTMCHWRLKDRQNGLFCAQNKPFSTWMDTAEHTALASGGRRR
jgi:hypothetical protein